MRARSLLWFGALLLPLVFGGVLTTPAWAGDDDTEREVREVKQKIELLLRESRELEEEGHAEKARDVRKHALHLRKRLGEFLEKRAGERKKRAAGGEAGMKRAHEVLRGLGQGIRALEMLGKKEEAARLRRIYEGVRERMEHAADRHEADPRREKRTERQVVEGWIELMGYGVKVLVKAGKDDLAHLLEHGKHAMELALAGKHDERSNRIRKEAPSRSALGECLLVAAEILSDHGDERHAKLMADLGRQWRQKKRGKERVDGRKQLDLDNLEHRIAILKMALPALREGERKEATKIVERALSTGRVLLAEREDDEAREILEQTPPLGHLAEVLHLASDLWMKFGDEHKARVVRALAQRYAERAHEQRRAGREDDDDEEHGEDRGEDAEHDDDDDDERAEAIEELREELQELRRVIERMQRRLKALSRSK